MKTHFVLSASAVCLCLASCVSDPAAAEKKKSVSIGRFGVRHAPAPAVAEVPGATPAPDATAGGTPAPPAPAPQPAPVAGPAPAPAPPPAPVVEEAPKKKSGFFSWLKRDKNNTDNAPVAVPVKEDKADQAIAGKEKKPAREGTVAMEPAPVRNKGDMGDGIRLPNMLDLPEGKDLKATNPSVPKSEKEGGAVISRPPVEKKKD